MKILPPFALAFVVVSAPLVIGQTRNPSPDTKPLDRPTIADASDISVPTKQSQSSEDTSHNDDAAVLAQKNYDSALALYTSGRFEEAIAALKEANKLRSDDAQSHYLLGMAYMQSKAYKDAADSFRKATRLKPDWPEAQFRFGVMAYVLGRRSQSNEVYTKLLSLSPPLARTLYRIIKTENDPAGTVERVVADLNSNLPPISEPATVKPAQPTEEHAATSSTEQPITNSSESAVAKANDNSSGDVSTLTSVYKIGVGDVLDVRLLNSSISRSSLYTVLDNGVIDLPVAGGAILVAGLTTEEVQVRITKELKRRAVEDHAQVSVGIRQYASHTVVVTGLVANPGTKVLRREAVPLYVVLAEVQPRVDASRVMVMRAGELAAVLGITDPPSLNFLIRPGDVINVMARPQEFYYIAGRVNFPGQKNYEPGITVLQAILAAGGVANGAKTVELSREGEGGLLTTTKLSLKDIKSGKVHDLKLKPGDRIEVIN